MSAQLIMPRSFVLGDITEMFRDCFFSRGNCERCWLAAPATGHLATRILMYTYMNGITNTVGQLGMPSVAGRSASHQHSTQSDNPPHTFHTYVRIKHVRAAYADA